MKYRKDFVTNSSSSSYICDICGRDESGWDMGISDAGMYQCQEGHTFCEDEACALDSETMIRYILEQEWNKDLWCPDEEIYKDFSESEIKKMDEEELLKVILSDGGYDVPSFMCPICNFERILDSDVLIYLMKKYAIDTKAILAELKREFGTYDNFEKFLRGK